MSQRPFDLLSSKHKAPDKTLFMTTWRRLIHSLFWNSKKKKIILTWNWILTLNNVIFFTFFISIFNSLRWWNWWDTMSWDSSKSSSSTSWVPRRWPGPCLSIQNSQFIIDIISCLWMSLLFFLSSQITKHSIDWWHLWYDIIL